MSKDSGYADAMWTTKTTPVVQFDAKQVYDLHIATLQVIENQLGRLHKALNNSDGDDDVTQEQITQLQDELVRLSESLGNVEVNLCTTNGKT